MPERDEQQYIKLVFKMHARRWKSNDQMHLACLSPGLSINKQYNIMWIWLEGRMNMKIELIIELNKYMMH